MTMRKMMKDEDMNETRARVRVTMRGNIAGSWCRLVRNTRCALRIPVTESVDAVLAWMGVRPS
jgi:hypothetical protein